MKELVNQIERENFAGQGGGLNNFKPWKDLKGKIITSLGLLELWADHCDGEVMYFTKEGDEDNTVRWQLRLDEVEELLGREGNGD